MGANNESKYKYTYCRLESKNYVHVTGGSRTYYGLMTPLHDGSQTARQSGAWDPTVTNTPAKTDDIENFNEDKISSEEKISNEKMI